MSQVAAKKKLSIDNCRIKVTAHFHEQGSVLQGTHTGACDGFHVDLSIDSSETSEQIVELLKMARQMCFTEDALARKIKLTSTDLLNGKPLE